MEEAHIISVDCCSIVAGQDLFCSGVPYDCSGCLEAKDLVSDRRDRYWA
jgi:hypothetical protein